MTKTKIHRKYERLYEEHLHGLEIRVPSEIKPNTYLPVITHATISFTHSSLNCHDIQKIYQVNIDHTEYGVRYFSPLGKALNGR